MKISPSITLPEYFYHWEKHTPHEVFLRQPFGDIWKDWTWQQAGQDVRKLAAYFGSLGLPPKSHIGIVSKNCAEWIISDLAIMMAGHVSVPFYPTLTAEQINLVLTHSGCKVLMVGKLDDWAGMKPGVPAGVQCVSFPTYNPDPSHVQWAAIMANTQPMEASPVPDLDELMTIIYTSGTTGNPKGVMLRFRSFSTVLVGTEHLMDVGITKPRLLSYLPLCHIAERGMLVTAALASGAVVHFSESLDTFAKNLAAAKPTHFGSVPRIWVKFQQGVLSKMPQKKLDLLLKVPIVSGIVKKKIRQNLGLDEARLILVGAAPMPVSLMQWFGRLGIVIQEVYGMTENTAAVSFTPRNGIKLGMAGKIIPTMQVKIDTATGEVCSKSEQNMIGYYNEPSMTAETIDAEGWLHSGDMGEIDSDGYLKITGRVKEMYKTSKGEYVAPAQIEMGFADNAFIEQVCVVGYGLPQPVALVVLSEAAKAETKETIAEGLSQTLRDLNPRLKPYERVKAVVVMREPWTVENNCMTPTLKIKRKEVESRFANELEVWSEQQAEVVWQ